MALTTFNVTGRFHNQDGSPIEGVSITVELTDTDRTGSGTVAPERQTFETDENGLVVMPLVPNAAGLNGTKYIITAIHPDTGKRIYNKKEFTVLSADAYLDTLFGDSPVATEAYIDTALDTFQQYHADLLAIEPELSTVAGIADEIVQVASLDADNIQTVADSAEEIGTVAGIADDITTLAAVASTIQELAVQNNLVGTRAPGVNDDLNAGYKQNSKWYDVSTSPIEVYICVNAAVGAAQWELITLDAADLGTMAVQNANAVAITGGAINGVVIGAVAPADATFTTLAATGVVTLSDATQATTATDGALRLAGGLSVVKNAIIGGAAKIAGALTVAGALLVGAGAVNATAIAPEADPNTGVYFPAADNMAIATAGVRRVHVNANGEIGVGTDSQAGTSLRVQRSLTGATTSYGIIQAGTVASDVTGNGFGIYNELWTQAAAFSFTSYYHFAAAQQTIGAGSAVSNQMGFFAAASLTGATNNYGFYGNLASGTGRYNIYMAGSADNYLAGKLGIGAAAGAFTGGLLVGRTMTGNTVVDAVTIGGAIVQSDVTSIARGVQSHLAPAAATFTLGSLIHFYANPTTFGAGATVTNQYGFHAESSLTAAGSNYGFYGNIASGTNRWNFYAAGSASNYMAGNLGIGSTTLTSINLNVGANLTGATSAYALSAGGTIASGVTSTAYYFSSTATTAAASFTVNTIQHYTANQGTFGAGSTVTNQYGFRAESSLTGATNNYAFYGNIGAASGRYNLYMNGTADNYLAGALGIGTTNIGGASGISVNVARHMTGATSTIGIYAAGQVQSDSTSTASYFHTVATTAAAIYTISELRHYLAVQSTFGAGSTVTSQMGFYAGSTLTGATNNFGFYGNIASGTNRWNLYMAGSAKNFMAGSLGIGSTGITDEMLLISGTHVSTGTSIYGAAVSITAPSTATTKMNGYLSYLSTAAASFTIGSLYHFEAAQNSIGAGSTVTSQMGFLAAATLTGATNNYGFYGNIASGTGRWNIYMPGTANNHMAGRLGLGNNDVSVVGLRNTLNISGATTAYGMYSDGAIQSGVTSDASYYFSHANTAAAAFTLTALYHFRANQGTIGAGSTVTSQFGFMVNSSLTGATNNYGFYGNIAIGAGRYNLYMNGTADNYMAGALGVGSTSLTGYAVHISKAITGAVTAFGISVDAAIQSDVTSNAFTYNSAVSTQAASFTLGVLAHFRANQGTIGAGSAVTTQKGFVAEATMTGAANNFGFYGDIALAANRWNFYANGTAPNLFTGSTIIGPGNLADAATDGFLYISTTTTGAPTGVPTDYSGRVAMVYDDTNHRLHIYSGAWRSVALT